MLEIAYVAGILDGESCIYSTLSNTAIGLNIRIAVKMTNKELLEELHKQFGGGFSQAKYYTKEMNAKPQWTWSVCGDRAVEILDSVKPYLIVKRKHIEIITLYNKIGVYTEPAVNIYFNDELNKLNKRGYIEEECGIVDGTVE